ncbi:MAG TPA: ECF-type sigma factor [Chthoniobacterales bacterium]
MTSPNRENAENLLIGMYDDLRRLATMRIANESQAQTLQATALVHEAWLRLTAKGDQTWQSRGHFYAAASEAMRRILIDNARRKGRVRHGGGQERANSEVLDFIAETTPEEKVLLIDEGLKKLEVSDPERAKVVVLKFFGGLTNKEVGDSLGISERSVDRHWACAKAWLLQWMNGSGSKGI